MYDEPGTMPGTATGGGPELDGALGLGARYTFPECRDPDPSLNAETTNSESCPGIHIWT